MPTDVVADRSADPASLTSRLREQFLEAWRAEILEAAREMFIAKGCDAAGVSAGNIYRYFPNKEALIVAVCEHCEIEDRSKFEAINEASASRVGALFAMGDDVFGQFDAEGSRESTMLVLESVLVVPRNPEFGPAVAVMITAVRDQLSMLVAAAQEARELDPSVDPRAMGELLLSVVNGMRLLKLQTDGDVDIDGLWVLLMRMVSKFGTEGVSSDLEVAR
jgi:AcrR family transcriptional regulator